MGKIQKSVAFELITGFAVIYAALYLGRILSRWSGSILPPSIMGMLLLVIALQFRWVKLEWVERCSQLFVGWMSLLFVPISVELVEHLETLMHALPAMLVTCVLATLVLLVVVGKMYQYLENRVSK